ncbi:DinB family protein [Halobacillus mangrovi]|uniref:DinB-like domain-containing protein n=1 Tax=Halobacillus mangrovi TaxID=402384 RepID=A0A1W5ZX08_9BACI|nr:DinB family protein [Halobacillus mangrovi]ARI77809.1 hypothetical protein HM131_13545 [Halobacillus mangrovi]
MKEEMLFQQMEFVRMRTLAALDATTEEIADGQPKGFSNTIRWNFGHIYVAQENLIHRFLDLEPQLSEEYKSLFNGGTSPDSWTITPPTLEEIRSKLAKQTDRIQETIQGRLDEKGEKPFNLGNGIVLTTVAEVLNFSIWHEGLHQGKITAMQRVQGVDELFATSR